MFDIHSLLRKNIRSLTPYSSARDEYAGGDAILLDANENPFNDPYNRYPDPHQQKLKSRIAALKSVKPGNVFIGNGSDEAIDLLIRAFCEPRVDNIISISPTYGMYRVCADINDVAYRPALLTPDRQLDILSIQELTDENSKLLFLCSPNNPTSNSFRRDDMKYLIRTFEGIVVLDEAYIDFSVEATFLRELNSFPNLVILQTLSKAWGMAGIRLGMAFADEAVIGVLDRIKYPYNINALTQQMALEGIGDEARKQEWVRIILKERASLGQKLLGLNIVRDVLPSDANFLMVRFENPQGVFRYLTDHKIIVRDRSGVELCEGFLRITIGTADENMMLMEALSRYNPLDYKTDP
ncbi:MAG: histidinol-phosphate transaminase [Bacteroidales bacterium]|nr:histidinol-phosphate transaminase [Bacteroidales bacterium]